MHYIDYQISSLPISQKLVFFPKIEVSILFLIFHQEIFVQDFEEHYFEHSFMSKSHFCTSSQLQSKSTV